MKIQSSLNSMLGAQSQWPKWPDLKQRAQEKKGGLTGI